MDEKLLLALVAVFGAIVGGLLTAVISPWVKHRLEQSVEKVTRQREQLQKWRVMIVQVARECADNNQGNAGQALQLHPDYSSLEPLLNDETRETVYRRNFIISAGQSLPYELEMVKNNIAEIEKKWGLL